MKTSTNRRTWTLDRIGTPIGTMLVVVDDEANLRALDWDDCAPRMHRLLRIHCGDAPVALVERRAPQAIGDAIAGYLGGDGVALDLIPVATEGTPFQRAVWKALRGVPSGTTVTYAELAARLGRPTATRAVGRANGSNPVGIVVPCHRVIGADAQLTGYAGGLARKRWLLEHEGALPARAS